ncbi:hypothetical protein GQ473_03130 [archaeon]|nr:hypothetical protein [archaeon]
MTTQSIFEIASKEKFRFPYNGSITVEDLFDLNKNQLNSVYRTLKSMVKSEEVTLLEVPTKEDEELSVKIEIVESIFNTKVVVENMALQAKETHAKKQKIMEIIGKKQDQTLEDTSVEELQKMLNEL